MSNDTSARLDFEPLVRPVAWLHDDSERVDVVHDEAKTLWLHVRPKQVEHYTIPLYLREHKQQLSTDEACTLIKNTLGASAVEDGNLLKLLRAVELAHGISA